MRLPILHAAKDKCQLRQAREFLVNDFNFQAAVRIVNKGPNIAFDAGLGSCPNTIDFV